MKRPNANVLFEGRNIKIANSVFEYVWQELRCHVYQIIPNMKF